MKQWMRQLALALMLSVASVAIAQEPPPAPPAPPAAIGPAVANAGPGVIPPVEPPPPAAAEHRRPLWNVLPRKRSCAPASVGASAHGFWNRHGYGCGSDPSIPGCTTLRDDLRFIFGSCRTFFGEPCLPREPRPSHLGRHGFADH